jgi:hypothetical protein
MITSAGIDVMFNSLMWLLSSLRITACKFRLDAEHQSGLQVALGLPRQMIYVPAKSV